MALVIDLRITSGITTRSLGYVEIRRQEELADKDNPNDEVHTYVARRINRSDIPPAEVTHRYGDGAWKLAEKALVALDIDTSDRISGFEGSGL